MINQAFGMFKTFHSTIGYGVKVITSTMKVFGIIESGKKIKDVYFDKNRTKIDVIKALGEGCYIILQSTDLLLDANSSLAHRVSSINKERIANSAVILKVALHIDDNWIFDTIKINSLNDISLLSDRVEDVAAIYQLGSSSSPILIKNSQKVQNPAVGVVPACVIKVSHAVCTAIYKAYQNFPIFVEKKEEIPFKEVEEIKIESPLFGHLKREGFSDVQEAPFEEKGNIDGNEWMENKEEKKTVIDGISLLSQHLSKRDQDFLAILRKIPEKIVKEQGQDNEWKWYCSITGKPIRYVVVPAIDPKKLAREKSAEVKEVYYEEEVLKKWMQKHINEMPPNWPDTFWPMEDEKIYMKDKNAQDSIDDLICKRMKKFKRCSQNEYKKLNEKGLGI